MSPDLRVYRRRLDQEVLPLLKSGLGRLCELTITDQEEGQAAVHGMSYALRKWEELDREFQVNMDAAPGKVVGGGKVLRLPVLL